MEPVTGPSTVHFSPSGAFTLEITVYSSGPDSWNYSRGIVKEVSNGKVIADVLRNLAGFWFTWVLIEDREYLLCGEDYQRYNVIDLACANNVVTFPPEAYQGRGFRWGTAYPSPNGRFIAVEGCYWAGSNDLVVYDFSDPMASPLPEVARVDDILQAKSWLNDHEFVYIVEDGDDKKQLIWRAPMGAP